MSTGKLRSEILLAHKRAIPFGRYTLLVRRSSGHRSTMIKATLEIIGQLAA